MMQPRKLNAGRFKKGFSQKSLVKSNGFPIFNTGDKQGPLYRKKSDNLVECLNAYV